MDEGNEQEGQLEPTTAPTSPMPLSMPPFQPAPPAGDRRVDPQSDPTLDEVWAVPSARQHPGTALPGAAPGPALPGAPEEAPPGGQPPYLPPYGYGWSPGGLPADLAGAPPAGGSRRRWTALGTVAVLAAGLGAGLGIAFAGTGSSGGPGQSLPSSSGGALSSTGPKMSVAAIAGAVEPAVVDIRTTVVSPAGEQSAAAGTGMILTSSGEVLTNNHVVENATSIQVDVAHRGAYRARVIGVNPVKDVALLQVEGVSGLPSVRLGNSSSVAVGAPVVAVGNALGMGGPPTVVSGTISAVGRTITASDPGLAAETLHDLFQTTAQIVQGDSGGPLLSSSGKVIGMDTAAASADSGTSVGFAIPIDQAHAIATQMAHHQAVGGTILGSSPFLGVYESSSAAPAGGLPGLGASGAAAPARGVTIAAIAGFSPAQRAGLRGGDVITSIDGKATATWPALQRAVQAKAPGETISVRYVGSSGTSRTVRVRLAGLPK